MKIYVDSELASHSVEAAERLLKMNILGIRRDKDDKLLPEDNFVLSAGDELLISSINAES